MLNWQMSEGNHGALLRLSRLMCRGGSASRVSCLKVLRLCRFAAVVEREADPHLASTAAQDWLCFLKVPSRTNSFSEKLCDIKKIFLVLLVTPP